MHNKYVEYIQWALRNKPIAYQLGFLQAHLAQIMLNDSKELDKFKRKVTDINNIKSNTSNRNSSNSD